MLKCISNKNNIGSLFIILSISFTLVKSQDEDLQLNIMPSEKYKINNKDLVSLKSDIERQLMQRVFEIQSNWDQREKLRHFAISRQPIRPPWSINAPTYGHNQLSVFKRPSTGADAKLVSNKVDNNARSNGFSFAENHKQIEIKDENINDINEILEDVSNEEVDSHMTNTIDVNTMAMHDKLIKEKNSLEEELKETKKHIEEMNLRKSNSTIENSINENLINRRNNLKNLKNYDVMDYDKISTNIYSLLNNNANVNHMNNEINIEKIKQMIQGKNKNEIYPLFKLIRAHPDIVSSSSKSENNQNINIQNNKEHSVNKNINVNVNVSKKVPSKINNIHHRINILNNLNKRKLKNIHNKIKRNSIPNGPVELPLPLPLRL